MCNYLICLFSILVWMISIPASWATDSTGIPSAGQQIYVPNMVYVLEQTWVSYNDVSGTGVNYTTPSVTVASGSESFTYKTKATCPSNFKPYVSLSLSKIYNETPKSASTGFGACISSFSTVSGTPNSVYSITVLTSLRYMDFNYTEADAYNDSSGTVISPLYAPKNSSGGTGYKISYNQTVSPPKNVFNDTGGITVTVYCYPQYYVFPANDPGTFNPNSWDQQCIATHPPF